MKKMIIAASLLAAASGLYAQEGAKRMHVVEEGTGTWCGYCPTGLGTMDYIEETYPDDFILLAYHYQDEMSVSAGTQFCKEYMKAFPTLLLNRKDNLFTSNSLSQSIANVDRVYAGISDETTFAGVSVKAYHPEELRLNRARVEVEVEFVLDLPDASDRYQVCLVLTENGRGPYKQNNNFSGVTNVDCGEWNNKGSRPNTYYDDVVFDIPEYPYIQNGIPAGLAKGDVHTITRDINVGSALADECDVVALLIDTVSKEVVNAAKAHYRIVQDDEEDNKGNQDGIDSVEGPSVAVNGGNGVILLGEPASGRVFTPAGRLVASFANASSVQVPAGLYLVHFGADVAKVVVK